MNRSTSVTIFVPGPLREFCDGARELPSLAADVRGALLELARDHPSLYRNVCDETGEVRRHINIFVNTSHMRDCDGLETALGPGDELIILPSVSGGCECQNV